MTQEQQIKENLRLEALHKYDILDTPPEESFDRITRLAKSALRVPMVVVSLVDADRQWFKSRQGVDVTETPRDISFCTHAIEENDIMVVEDATKDERFKNSPLVTENPHIRFYAGVPLRTPDGHNVGSLCAIDIEARTISDLEINMLSDLARLVVDELELRKIASRDSLTGAFTRRSFNLEADKEFSRTRRYERPASVIAFDIDHFKSVNDTYGHAIGDLILKAAVKICLDTVRNVDICGRIGGEEFAIVLPETGAYGAMLLSERLRELIAAHVEHKDGHEVRVTASFGVTEFSRDDEDVDDIMKRADEALYHAKRTGRNQSVLKMAGQDFEAGREVA